MDYKDKEGVWREAKVTNVDKRDNCSIISLKYPNRNETQTINVGSLEASVQFPSTFTKGKVPEVDEMFADKPSDRELKVIGLLEIFDKIVREKTNEIALALDELDEEAHSEANIIIFQELLECLSD